MRSPVGHFCAGGTAKVACPANKYNAKLGQSVINACLPCTDFSTEVTSAEGSATCTLALVDITCASPLSPIPFHDKGREYDAGSQTCVLCPAGTYRDSATMSSCLDW